MIKERSPNRRRGRLPFLPISFLFFFLAPFFHHHYFCFCFQRRQNSPGKSPTPHYHHLHHHHHRHHHHHHHHHHLLLLPVIIFFSFIPSCDTELEDLTSALLSRLTLHLVMEPILSHAPTLNPPSWVRLPHTLICRPCSKPVFAAEAEEREHIRPGSQVPHPGEIKCCILSLDKIALWFRTT